VAIANIAFTPGITTWALCDCHAALAMTKFINTIPATEFRKILLLIMLETYLFKKEL